MRAVISQRHRRTYFTQPLVEESIRYLPEAINHPTSVVFRTFLTDHLHHSSLQTRKRFAEYIAQRYSQDGQMNLALARALAKFGDSRTGREILYFELLQSTPVLHDIASLWLAEQIETGGPRSSLLAFLEKRLGGRSADEVAGAAVAAFRRCRKLASPKAGIYVPVWGEPPIEAFLYVLARLYPQRSMVRFDLFAGLPVIRAMLWPRPCLTSLLEKARLAGHISKVSQLDQYHQFTLADSGAARLGRLVADGSSLGTTLREPAAKYGMSPGDRTSTKRSPSKRPLGKNATVKVEGGRAVPTESKTKKTNSTLKSKGGQKISPRQLSLLPRED